MNRTNAVAVIIHEVFAAPIAESMVEEDSSANASGALNRNNIKAPKDAFSFFIFSENIGLYIYRVEGTIVPSALYMQHFLFRTN